MKQFKKSYIYIFLLFLFFLLFFSVVFSIINLNNNTILKGVSINNIDISNLSKEDARNKIKDIVNTKSSTNINFIYNDETIYTSTFENFNIQYQIDEAINSAYIIGKSTNIFKNNYEILNLKFNHKNINLNISLNDDKLSSISTDLSSSISDALIQSDYYIENTNLILTSGKSGKIITKELLKESLLNNLQNILSTYNNVVLTAQIENPTPLDIDTIYSEVCKE